jgi:hypothetical protein
LFLKKEFVMKRTVCVSSALCVLAMSL